jgi:hypothetical protein
LARDRQRKVAFSRFATSLIRNQIPSSIRIRGPDHDHCDRGNRGGPVLEAFLFDISKQLSVYVGLIINNCNHGQLRDIGRIAVYGERDYNFAVVLFTLIVLVMVSLIMLPRQNCCPVVMSMWCSTKKKNSLPNPAAS